MKSEEIKVYTYTRVSTLLQTEGYSLDAQKERIKTFADANNYKIIREYEDAGRSGKSIEGRPQFNEMLEDIKSNRDNVSFVLVFKLSRFGRNTADILNSLQTMQDNEVNLICIDDSIDSSKEVGKLLISVLSAVAEIERENIRTQTMEGRIQKAREGKWNGGVPPYGYKLVDGKLEINEDEAPAVRKIFDLYVNTDMGSNAIAKYLANNGIFKIPRQNGKNPLFSSDMIRKVIKNPVYCGKIAYGRRKTEKVHGTRDKYHTVEQDNYNLYEGSHDPIISEAIWESAQVKVKAMAKKYEKVNKKKDETTYLLQGMLKCPVCGAGMYGNKSNKYNKDRIKGKTYYYYGCKHRQMLRGHKCEFKKQIPKESIENELVGVITKLVKNPQFAEIMQSKIQMKVDTHEIDQEIENYNRELKKNRMTKDNLGKDMDVLDPEDKHYEIKKNDLQVRLDSMYDKIEETEILLDEARKKKRTIEKDKITGDNIYKILIYFEKLYDKMNDSEKRQFLESLISEIQIYPEKQPNGQWLKSINFRLPIIEKDMDISLDNNNSVETVTLLVRVSKKEK